MPAMLNGHTAHLNTFGITKYKKKKKRYTSENAQISSKESQYKICFILFWWKLNEKIDTTLIRYEAGAWSLLA